VSAADKVERKAKDVVVAILGGGRGQRLDPLTRWRAKPAVPIAGKYRLIDIPISNAIHSHMERMLVLTQFNSNSLHRHLHNTYKFDMFSRGFVQLLAAQQTPNYEDWFQGTADAVRRNLDTIASTPGDLVLILAGDHMYRMDYREMLRSHIEHDADITLSLLPCSEQEIAGFGAVRVDSEGRVAEFREKPTTAEARAGMEVDPKLLAASKVGADRPYLASMGIYLFKKQALIDLLDNDLIDFGADVIPAAVDTHRVQAHFFDGYWRDIGTIRTFYDAHMDMCQTKPPFDWYDGEWPFFTHPRYLPGSRLRGCQFDDSVLAGGATIDNSNVQRSIIGLRSQMREAEIKNSLIMGAEDFPPASPAGAPPVGIGPGSIITNAIVDLNARIGKNVRITNANNVQDAEGENYVIRDGIVVIPKEAVLPDGTVI
jgi:glucose-1-phosphate adenylyltransferase